MNCDSAQCEGHSRDGDCDTELGCTQHQLDLEYTLYALSKVVLSNPYRRVRPAANSRSMLMAVRHGSGKPDHKTLSYFAQRRSTTASDRAKVVDALR